MELVGATRVFSENTITNRSATSLIECSRSIPIGSAEYADRRWIVTIECTGVIGKWYRMLSRQTSVLFFDGRDPKKYRLARE